MMMPSDEALFKLHCLTSRTSPVSAAPPPEKIYLFDKRRCPDTSEALEHGASDPVSNRFTNRAAATRYTAGREHFLRQPTRTESYQKLQL